MPKFVAEDGASLSPGDFDEIEKAVMETARGRWFLGEYAKRLRQSDTTSMLAAMAKLEAALAANQDEIVNRLARALSESHSGSAEATAAGSPGLTAEQRKYFQPDEDLFVPPGASRRPSAPVEDARTCS